MSKLKVVSLFSGLGGIDYGLESAGFRTIFATDIDSDCCETIKANRKWQVECIDIHDVDGISICESTNTDTDEISLLVGGPPCQPFSKSGYGSVSQPAGLKDERSNTISEFFRIASELRPRSFMIENVPQFISSERVNKYLQKKTAELNLITNSKYRLNVIKLNCADYGVPQIRQRVFIIASREGKEFHLPIATHSTLPAYSANKHRTSWDALSQVRVSKAEIETLRVGGRWGNLLETIPAGQNYLWHTRRGGGKPIFKWRSRFWNFLLKLHPDMPSWTIPASPGMHTGPFHWENRRLSINELAALQTLPKNLIISGGITSAKKQIGNAVPSAIAEMLGIEIRRQFLDGRPRNFPKLATQQSFRKIPNIEF